MTRLLLSSYPRRYLGTWDRRRLRDEGKGKGKGKGARVRGLEQEIGSWSNAIDVVLKHCMIINLDDSGHSEGRKGR